VVVKKEGPKNRIKREKKERAIGQEPFKKKGKRLLSKIKLRHSLTLTG